MGFGKAPKIDVRMQTSKNKRVAVSQTKGIPIHSKKWNQTSLIPKTYKNRWKVKGR